MVGVAIGSRVIGVTRLAPGPCAATLLGDLGTRGIPVESPPYRRAGEDVADIPRHGGRAARQLGINPNDPPAHPHLKVARSLADAAYPR